MAIILNDNIKINAGKPSESKYLNSSNLPYALVADAIAAIPIATRHLGLTVLIQSGASNTEYWWKTGVQDIDLIEKKFASEQITGDFITGATNLGYFSGTTGIQRLAIAGGGFGSDTGDYFSEYQWYYVDNNGDIRIGAPAYDAPLRRGYVNAARTKSWVWNVPTNQWQISLNDIVSNVGEAAIISPHTGFVFTATTWINSSSEGVASANVTVHGILNSGTTEVTFGNAIYKDKSNQELHLRTIVNDTPDFLKIESDDNYIRFSGVSSVISASNHGGGFGVFSGQTGSDLKFRTLTPSGDTTITQAPDGRLIIFSSSDGSADAITGATNYGSGIPVFSGITNRSLDFNSIIGSGDTSVSLSGNTIVVHSESSEQTYDLQSPAAITVGGISGGTILTGKTAFELFEELLVPVLYPAFTTPSNTFVKSTPSGTLFEVGYQDNFNFSAGFNRGTINPAYGTSGFRSGLPTTYNYTGTGLPSTFSSSALSDTQTSTGYTILIGNQSWSGSVTFLDGEQPKDSKNNDYDSPYPSGTTSTVTRTVEGVHPLFGTTSTIGTLTKQALVSMLSGNNVAFTMVAETGGNKQKFDIPDTWTGAPTNRPLVGIQTFNTVSNVWEYQGGNAANSLTFWGTSATTHTINSSVINYTRYTYNSSDRSSVQIRLVF